MTRINASIIDCNICKSKSYKNMYKGYVKCTRCRFVYKNPQPIFKFEKDYWGVVKDPDGKVRDLIKERPQKLEDHKDEIRFVNKLTPGKILDVGCGYGFFLSAIRTGWEKHGIELSEHTSKFIKKNYPGIKLHNKHLREIKYSSGYFDVVHMYHVIEHMTDPDHELKEINRVIKKGGLFLVGTPNIESFCSKRFKENFRLIHDKTHIMMFGPKTLSMILQKNGFEIFKTVYPFLRTRHFTFKNLLRLLDTRKMSPPFYGNIITVYAKKVRDV